LNFHIYSYYLKLIKELM